MGQFLEGRSLDSLTPDEVYVLAKILPDFTKDKRLHAYKQVLREALDEGAVNSSSSLDVLQNLRRELDINDTDYHGILTELGVENPDLLNPEKQRSREDWLRLKSYRDRLAAHPYLWNRRKAKGLGLEILEVLQGDRPIDHAIKIGGALRPHLSLEPIKQIYALTASSSREK